MRGIFHSHVRQVEDDRIGDVVLRIAVNNGAGVPLAVQALDLHGGEGVLIGGNHSELAHVAASLRGDLDVTTIVGINLNLGGTTVGNGGTVHVGDLGVVHSSDSHLSIQICLLIFGVTGQLHVDGFGDIVDGSAHHTLAGHIGLGQVCGGAALHFFQSQGVGAQLHVIPGTVGSTQVIQRQLDGVAVYQVVIQIQGFGGSGTNLLCAGVGDAVRLINTEFGIQRAQILVGGDGEAIKALIRHVHRHALRQFNPVAIHIDGPQIHRRSRSAERNHCDDQHERQKHRK